LFFLSHIIIISKADRHHLSYLSLLTKDKVAWLFVV